MTTIGWLDETGLVPLPSGARVRGRRLGDPASAADSPWHPRRAHPHPGRRLGAQHLPPAGRGDPWQRRWLRGVR